MEVDRLSFVYNEKLRASFRNNVKNFNSVYKQNSVILLVSPTQPYYKSKEKLNALIELINRSQFKKCHIVVGDTNYQHTLKILYPDSQKAYLLADNIGLEWIKNNKNIYSSLNMPFTLTRWKDWVNTEKYLFHRKKLDTLFLEDINFKNAFFISAKEFIERNKTQLKISDANDQFALECCLEYLKEECAIIMPYWADLEYPFIIYPSKMLAAMKETYHKLVVPYYSTHPHWLSIRYTRRKNLSMQN